MIMSCTSSPLWASVQASLEGHYCTQGERELLALPVRMGGIGLTNPSQEAASEYVASANISGPFAQRIKSQVHEPPDETEIRAAQREMCQVKDRYLIRRALFLEKL